jgi:hypothetical protein
MGDSRPPVQPAAQWLGSLAARGAARRPCPRDRLRPRVAVTELVRAERLDELRRGLAPGGRIAIASQPRCSGAAAATSRSAASEIENLPRRAGFTQVSTQTLALSPPVICVLAAAPRPDA